MRKPLDHYIGLLTLIFFLLSLQPVYANNKDTLVVTTRGPASKNDRREYYYKDVLTLALEKTKRSYGNYEVKEVPAMNQLRDAFAIGQEIYLNYIINENYEDKFLNSNVDYIAFPLDFGLTGTRICFVNPNIREEIKSVEDVAQLKKYSIGQGVGWADAEILRYNGFKVIAMQNYDGLFKMIATGRIDLFCRGVNELPKEYESFKAINNLTYDESFAIVYPLPRFFIINKKNTVLKRRIEDGLMLAYKDGSLNKLFQKHHARSIEFAGMKNRKIFRIENPLIKKLPKDWEEYLPAHY
ncbi:MAG: hypothetical protein EOO52_09330 [Gammaproteobacteria bacterium]|nr:MAG: hypothetical protein EOO52_09330 [Gammaproteobacteria bacterium]